MLVIPAMLGWCGPNSCGQTDWRHTPHYPKQSRGNNLKQEEAIRSDRWVAFIIFISPKILAGLDRLEIFAYGTITLCGWPFQGHSANI